MSLVKGSLLQHTKHFVHERFGPDAWRMQVEGLPAAGRPGVLQPVPACWYDLGLFRRLLRALCEYTGRGSGFIMGELGRFTADRELLGAQRWVLHLARPSFAVRNLDLCWRRMFDVGRWDSQHEDGTLELRLAEWEGEPALCDWIGGYVRRTLELFGWQVEGLAHAEGLSNDAATWAFRAGGHPHPEAVRVNKLTSRAEVLQAARVLAHCTRAEALARFVVELSRVQLGCSGAQLWVLGEEGEGMRLLCSAGEWEREGQRSCLLLETGGRTVGRIEVRHVQERLEEASATLLDELMPFIAESLVGVLEPRREQPAVLRNEDEAFRQRLQAARHLWGLTARQADVVALAVQGQTNKEIAGALGCQKSTVELHMSHILKKCGADNRSMLAASFWTLR
ncbi:MAG TPA: LuxR C-terminal-related transcriptional regulator [Archangium sp.]|uniref:helix-turn-helix transcriptional regulator n=1 Tax=Archangium sp. TaxID=1872627 RepID=UPI002E2F670D|nr:LuxR C-terminal-related transcriptional regulator [Archangium sp.]HEX5747359.1 LuxR C-terminal-related transcriptional regulator [Archangium sp.]